MFFFGIASHISTIVILGIFSLIFFFQGAQKIIIENTNDISTYAEYSTIDNYSVATTIESDKKLNNFAFFKPKYFEVPLITCFNSFLIYPKTKDDLKLNIPRRGPPVV